MFNVSESFKLAAKQPVQEHKITGTIGSVSFSETNIVDGSFTITNQSTDTNDVVLGSCYVGQLTAEFIGINIAWGKWINKTITPTFQLKIDENTWESVPLGVFKIKEAKHTERGVQVTAYDNMIKFDKKFKKSHYMNLSGMTNIIDQLCTDAGVILGMSYADIEALPNGDRTGINIYGSKGKKAEFANDITTLRDLLFWVAQTLGCFATINRAGQLVFRPYTQTVVDRISEQNRIEGATFADYVTHYVGIYVVNLDDNTEDYYGYDVTALTEERNETLSEITADNELIAGYIEDLAEWDAKLANHECTQQEYDAAVAEITAAMHPLELEVKQLAKRLDWLNEAIAQASDDGSDMVLGANPLVMAKSLVTRDSQRREILGALDGITYTPFQASVVCGCIYDLGDVIQFSGGLYNSDTDSFGCVMAYTYTHNGGTELEGFGVDPSVVVVRNKTQKSTDRASRNGIDATHNQIGTQVDPADTAGGGENAIPGKRGDMYVKYQGAGEAEITIGAGMTEESESGDADSGYNVTALCIDDSSMEGIYFHFTGLVVGETYEISLDNQITTSKPLENWREHCLAIVCTDYYCGNGNSGWYPGHYWEGAGVLQAGVAYDIEGGFFIPLYYDTNNHSYSHEFVATGTDFYIVVSYTYLMNARYDDNVRGHVKICKLTGTRFGNGKANITHTNIDGNWREITYASEVSQTQGETGGTEIAEITNNDGTKTKVYQKTVTANPQGTASELLEKITIGEQTFNVGGGNVDDVKVDGTSVVTNKIANINTMSGATAQTDGAKGLVPTPTAADSGKYLKGDGTWAEVQGGGGSAEMLAPTPFIYSETEEQVGIWIDGKPLYAKTKSFTNVSKSGSLSFGVANAETVFIKDIGKASDAIPIPYVHGSAPSNNIGGFLTKTSSDVTWEFRSGNDAPSTLSGFMTLFYTKTTDTTWQGGFKAYGFTPVIYSETEREVGVWTDGKPIYEKTYYENNVVNGTVVTIQNADKVLIKDAYSVNANGNLCIPYSYDTSNADYHFVLYADGQSIKTETTNVWVNTYPKVLFTVQYTKTTDVTGSGKYAELGVPAVHYDGEERVIGTWFGKPLYKKTYRLSSAVNLVQGQWTAISEINTANIHECITVKAMNNWAVLDAFTSSFNESSLMILNNRGSNITVETIVLEYTKTTD